MVEEDGSLGLWLGEGGGRIERLSTGKPLRAQTWYFACCGYDAQTKRVFLHQEPLQERPTEDTRAVVEGVAELAKLGESDAPLLMAGYCERQESGRTVVGGHFNGKIDGPRLFNRALSPQEIESLKMGALPPGLRDAVTAAWDFGRDFASVKVTDASPNGLHGQVVNMPVRAVTGHNWSGNAHSFQHAPSEYAAIHFHDDDLEDAGWEADFELQVSPEMKSGIYAAHLVAGNGEDYVPFFVRPALGKPTASILFLAPTASYLAYADAKILRQSRPLLQQPIGVAPAPGPGANHPGPGRFRTSTWWSTTCSASTTTTRTVAASPMLPACGPWSTCAPSTPCRVSRIRAAASPTPTSSTPTCISRIGWRPRGIATRQNVATDDDLHFDGAAILDPYRVVVTGTHPEYWSAQMLDALEAYLAHGGRVMYLGGNGFFWVTSFHSERPHVIEVRRWHGTRAWEAEPGEYYQASTGELGGPWRSRGRPTQQILGVGFASQGFDHSLPFKRLPGSFDSRAAFIFEGVGKDEPIGDFGLVMEGAGGFEIDRVDPLLGTPSHTLVLATATGFSPIYTRAVDEILMPPLGGGPPDPQIRADMTYFEGPNGGAVFCTSSIAWCGSLSHNGYDNNVSRITDNVLKRFASPEPIPLPGS